MNDNNHNKVCPVCGFPIFGKKGKKFCSDGCRNKYYNEKKKDTHSVIRNVNDILRKNYQILRRFANQETLHVDQYRLLNAGFNFDFYTSSMTVENVNWILCYDIGYTIRNVSSIHIQLFDVSFSKIKKT